MVYARGSVSERRFPASHSCQLRGSFQPVVYPSDDSLQATAAYWLPSASGAVYPSDDSLQATAPGNLLDVSSLVYPSDDSLQATA